MSDTKRDPLELDDTFIYLRLHREQKQKLKRLAAIEDRSMQSMARRLIEEKLAEYHVSLQ